MVTTFDTVNEQCKKFCYRDGGTAIMLDHTLYQARVSQVDDYSTDDNWFTISGCRGLQVAENIDNSWSLFVDQVFEQIRRELSFK